MKSIIKTSKRSIIAILTLCILLGIAGTAAMAKETTATVEETAVATEDTAVVTEETTQELVPMIARGCGNACTHDDMVYDHSENDGAILVFVCDRCGQYIRQKAG